MKLLARDNEGNPIVVCCLCTKMTYPQKESHIKVYMDRPCKCVHSQTVKDGHRARRRDRSTEDKILIAQKQAEKLGVDVADQ